MGGSGEEEEEEDLGFAKSAAQAALLPAAQAAPLVGPADGGAGKCLSFVEKEGFREGRKGRRRRRREEEEEEGRGGEGGGGGGGTPPN